ncbi:sensor histidine kinase [Nocardiopsis lambiniae]|uniref:sensor histidine kinase n=1 Tax=Nocardiopsis lambiniae TaxID=3075539 RepID=UPI0037C56D7E
MTVADERIRGGVLFHPSGWRLGTRFAVMFALVVAVTIALVGTLAYTTAAALIRADAREDFSRVVTALSDQIVSLYENQDGTLSSDRGPVLAGKDLQIHHILPDGRRQVAVADGASEVALFAPTAEDMELATAGEPGEALTREQTVQGQAYRVATVSLGDGAGALQVIQQMSPTERMLGRLATQILWVGVLVALGAACVGWLIGHRTTGRLARLTDAAEYVSSTGRLDPLAGRPDTPVGEAGHDEVGRLGDAFNAMLARLARSQEEQRRLVQDAAHELRTPLTSLYTNIQVLGRADRLTPEARGSLIEDLRGETRELTSLVNELVGLATGDHEDETPSRVVLADVAEKVAARTRRRTGREIVVDADDSAVHGRPGALERAMANPVENSAKFDPDGTAPIEIRIRRGTVEVLDRGPGIDPEETGRVFERFYRATSARGLPGSGLGLSMVREIARAHDGEVFARNREGGGAVIGFTLPEITPADPPSDGPA